MTSRGIEQFSRSDGTNGFFVEVKTRLVALIVPPALVPSHRVRHHLPRIIASTLIATGLIYGASFVWHKASARKTTSPPFATQTVNDLTIKLMTPAGQLQKGDNDVLIEFRDSDGQLVDVGDVNRQNRPGQSNGSAGDWRRSTRKRLRARAVTIASSNLLARRVRDIAQRIVKPGNPGLKVGINCKCAPALLA